MKRILIVVLAAVFAATFSLSSFAAEGNVTYTGRSGDIVFAPGSDRSLTDLFPDFKGVMPGDSLTQKILVKNNADDEVKVNLYVRSLGSHDTEASKAFLSQLRLRVQKSDENGQAYMFDAAASEPAQFSDWVLLGTLYSGGEVNLSLILDVPASLGNEFQDAVGYLDWQFMIEEMPVDPEDPDAPPTSDNVSYVWIAVIGVVAILVIFILLWRRRNRREDD